MFGLVGDRVSRWSATKIVAKSLGLAVFVFVVYASALGLLTNELGKPESSPPLRSLVTLSAVGVLAGWKPDKAVADLQVLLNKIVPKGT